jgi:aryl-alcohol dehydrogenase-like predicted oxidoreductase
VIGASNYTGPRLAAALKVSESHGLPRYESLQPQYNLAERSDYEKNLEPICEQHQLGVIPYFSLAAGFLTGKYRSQKDLENRARAAVAGKYVNERGLRILNALDTVAARHNATAAQVALAWLMARPSITAPIASATSVDQLRDLLHATQLKLDPASIKELNDASEESNQAAA